MKRTDKRPTKITGIQEDGSYLVSCGSSIRRMYYEKPVYKKKRRKSLSKWQFLCKKARELKKHPTLSEIIFERKLQEIGHQYKSQWPYLYEGFGGICDFYIMKLGICVEIDGGYHLDKDQQQTDRVKDFVYKKMKKSVLRLTNAQATYLSIEQLKTLIESI